MNRECPICGSKEFGDYRRRKNIRCKNCGSFERSRLLYCILRSIEKDIQSTDGEILHFAPEKGIYNYLISEFRSRYKAKDFDIGTYKKSGLNVEQFDLCRDINNISSYSISLIVHIHVLEHIRCNVAYVLSELNRIIKKGGYHVFGLPFLEGYYQEDLNPMLTEEDRIGIFGHEDHVRNFGKESWNVMFSPFFKGFKEVNINKLVNEENLAKFNIPGHVIRNLSGHSVLVYKKL